MALRKLQAEIDKTLKSVGIGVELFESTFDKLNHANNATQKDKLENDLKTQIKKLQRLRDQIKAWLGSSDIKDKSALVDNRKLIEVQMERFKALEKEMKMKAFSKEGLIAQSRLDPAEKAKRDMIDWIGNTTDEVSRQIEQTEAEAEALQATRKKKASGDRLAELDELNDRRNWHIGRLEVVQRMLENGQLSVEDVESIQEDVKYFIEANSEEDFDFDNGIYDELNLQEEEEILGAHDDGSNLDSSSVADILDTPAPKTPAKEEPPKKTTPSARKDSHDEPPPSPVAAKKTPSRKATMESKIIEPKTSSKSVDVPPVPPVPTPAPAPAQAATPAITKAAPLPPIRYAAAAAAAVASTVIPIPAPATATVPPPAAPLSASPLETASPTKPKVEIPEPTPVTEATPTGDSITPATGPSPNISAAEPEVEFQLNGHAPPPPPGLVSARSPVPSSQPSTTIQTPNVPANLPTSNGAVAPPGYAPQHAESSRTGAALAQQPQPQTGVMGHLMQSFELAKELSNRRGDDVSELNATLDASYSNAPQQLDGEPPRYYHPKNPIKTPSYYPQARLPTLEDKTMYSRLDLDQLFYIFYYMTGTYEQWLAARELKRQSWRFHKQYLTWFQRAHNPQAITEDYEQGGYFYFDWENSWCQRRKSDFRFEYRWLSDH